jgi:chemotaxis protein methyltransferase CheR
MIYFDPATKEQVLERVLTHLKPNGYLFVGHSETLCGLTLQVTPVMPAVYCRCQPRQQSSLRGKFLPARSKGVVPS